MLACKTCDDTGLVYELKAECEYVLRCNCAAGDRQPALIRRAPKCRPVPHLKRDIAFIRSGDRDDEEE